MKYTPDTVKKITDALEEGSGRVNACKVAGISYQAFLNWMDSKVEFVESIKKAEDVANAKIKDVCRNVIIKSAQEGTWQAAAWMLERKWSEEYSLKQKVDMTGRHEISISKDQLEKAIKDVDKMLKDYND